MATSLEELEKKRSRSIIHEQILGAKITKIGPVDPEIIGIRAIIKKLEMHGKAQRMVSLA